MAETIYYIDFSGDTTGWNQITGSGISAALPSDNGGTNSSGYSGASGGDAICIVPDANELNEVELTGQVSSINKTNLVLSFGYYRRAAVNDIDIYYSVNGGGTYTLLSYTSPPDEEWTLTTINLPANCNGVSDIQFKISHQHVGLPLVFDVFLDDFLITAETPMQIKDTPQQYDPVHNDLPFVVSGTNNTNSNYKYWCDVYFAGSTSYDYRLFTFPRPDGFGFFNLKTIIRDYVSGDISLDDDNFERNTNSYKGYNVYFGESYGSTGTVSSGMVSSGTYFAFNGSLEWDEFVDYSQNTRAMRTTGTAKFLTNLNQSLAFSTSTYNRIGLSENAFVHMAQKENTAISYMNIVTYDSAGSVNGTFRVTNTYSMVSSSDNNRFLRFPCGTANLLNIPSASISVVSGALPIIDSDVYYYTVQTLNSSLFATSYMLPFKVEDKCSKYDTYRVHYLNKWSGFDSFTFSAKNVITNDIERKQYKKYYGSISSAGNWSYDKSERGIRDYDTKYKGKLLLRSDWITQDEYDVLVEMITSPEVYIEISGELQAINILTANYEDKNIENNKLLNIEIECEFTQYNRRQ